MSDTYTPCFSNAMGGILLRASQFSEFTCVPSVCLHVVTKLKVSIWSPLQAENGEHAKAAVRAALLHMEDPWLPRKNKLATTVMDRNGRRESTVAAVTHHSTPPRRMHMMFRFTGLAKDTRGSGGVSFFFRFTITYVRPT